MKRSLAVLLCLLLPQLLDAQEPQRLRGRHFKTRTVKGVEFARHGKEILTLDLHLPKVAGPHPVILVVPGGAWRMRMRWSSFARAMAREGIAAASIVVRTVPSHTHPAQIEDVRRAFQYLKRHAAAYGLDAERMAVAGVSSGGHLAALMATEEDQANPKAKDPVARESTRPLCALSYSGPMDLVYDGAFTPSAFQLQLVIDYLGLKGPVPTHDEAERERWKAVAREASPRFKVSRDDPPLLLVHGTKDSIVPVDQGRRMWQTLEEVGDDHRYVEIPGRGHFDYLVQWDGPLGWVPVGKKRKFPKWWQSTREFLRRHLLGEDAAKGD